MIRTLAVIAALALVVEAAAEAKPTPAAVPQGSTHPTADSPMHGAGAFGSNNAATGPSAEGREGAEAHGAVEPAPGVVGRHGAPGPAPGNANSAPAPNGPTGPVPGAADAP